MFGATRGIATLVAAVVGGFLLWLATQIGAETQGEYWATYGLIAAAGLVFALSQLLGGWTKWGWPRLSLGVFLLGFLPVLALGGWVLLARQPADFFNTSNWSRDWRIYDFVADLGNILPAIAFAIGLTFGLVFDTAGPRRDVAPAAARVGRPATAAAGTQGARRVADDRADTAETRVGHEPLTAERPEAEEPRRGRFRRRRRDATAVAERPDE